MKALLARLVAGEALEEAEAFDVFASVMAGDVPEAALAALLTALRMRGETPAELVGLVQAMRARMLRVSAPPGAIDVCGTGGDGRRGLCTLNVSTAVAFVAAACGIPVAKHGNRAVSSTSGGADVLTALGVPRELPPAVLERQLREPGLVFLFAPQHHPALRHAAAVRATLGFRTIFNLAGPLCNPAGVRRQLLGVHDPRWLRPMAELLVRLGAEQVWIVHGQGCDELVLAGETHVCAGGPEHIEEFIVTPEQAGLARAPLAAIAGGGPAANAAALRALLAGERGAYRDTVLLNAAAALIVAGAERSLCDGVARAALAIDSGAALACLAALATPELAA